MEIKAHWDTIVLEVNIAENKGTGFRKSHFR
jgi:hypothetical protein